MQITHSQLMYYVWCLKFGYDIGSCESHARYQKWIKEETLEHCGDCTKDPCPCERCVLQDIEKDAQNILIDIIITDKDPKGWCKSECLKDCQFDLKSVDNRKARKLTIKDCTCGTGECAFHKECIGDSCAPGINLCDNPDHK